MSATYEQKLDRARKLAREAGLKLSYDVPPVLRVFGKLGLPVRPIHFMSATGLFSYYFLVLSPVFVGFHWITTNFEFDAWVLKKLKELGVKGTLVLAALVTLFDTFMVRLRARRYGLPSWRDL